MQPAFDLKINLFFCEIGNEMRLLSGHQLLQDKLQASKGHLRELQALFRRRITHLIISFAKSTSILFWGFYRAHAPVQRVKQSVSCTPNRARTDDKQTGQLGEHNAARALRNPNLHDVSLNGLHTRTHAAAAQMRHKLTKINQKT